MASLIPCVSPQATTARALAAIDSLRLLPALGILNARQSGQFFREGRFENERQGRRPAVSRLRAHAVDIGLDDCLCVGVEFRQKERQSQIWLEFGAPRTRNRECKDHGFDRLTYAPVA
jgi:hypothetical protein